MSGPRTARQRVHQELTGEILATARAHLARDGAVALSLRSIARDLEMSPSALYRYFESRDALLSALILAAYESLADEGERASAAAFARPGSDAERFMDVPRAMRAWALAHPHEWSLIFGTPVPGYQAPQDTVVPYARLAAAMVRPVLEAREAGRLRSDGLAKAVPDDLRDAVAPVTDALFPDMPAATVVLALQAWTTVIGGISLELFGHWRNTILEPGLFFEDAIRQVATSVGLV